MRKYNQHENQQFPLWRKNYQQFNELNGQTRQTIHCNKTHVKSK